MFLSHSLSFLKISQSFVIHFLINPDYIWTDKQMETRHNLLADFYRPIQIECSVVQDL